MPETIEIEDLTFEVRRSAKRKTLGLTVERDARLIAHLPEYASVEQAREMIQGRLVWVYEKLAVAEQRPKKEVFRKPEFVDGEGFYFLGRHYRLKLFDPPADGDAGPTLRFEGDRLLFNRRQVAAGERRVAEYYTREAHPYLNEAVQRWSRIVGVSPAKYVQVMDLGYRWASCSADGTLNFHWRIMQLPPQVIDYVVVHELTHLRVPDHSAKFWTQMERVLPEYAKHREWLRAKGGEL